MSWALDGMVWRGSAGGLHHWIWLGQREARTGEKHDITWIKNFTLSLHSNSLLTIWSRKPWANTSQTLPRCTSTCCLCTATVVSRAKAQSCFGDICSTCAVSPVYAGLCWSVRSSWCPSTRRLALSRKVPRPSLWRLWPSERWSISLEAWLMHDEKADVNFFSSLNPDSGHHA